MQKPLVAILSCSPRFTSDLTAALGSRYQLMTGESMSEVAELARSREPRALVADFLQTPATGLAEREFLRQWNERYPNCLIAVCVTANALPAYRDDADDRGWRLTTGHDASAVGDALDGTLMKAATETSPEQPVPSEEQSPSAVLSGITRRFETNSPAVKGMLRDLEVAALHDVTILLIGETGSGKTFLSRLIHEVSPRRLEPFLHVACGALPNELIESELFGHMKGSFTSAHADKQGKFVAAAGGTILLDEIDVLGPEQQVKLLRVIETGEFEPVGSNETLTSRARLVVASNLDLQPLVEQGRFRPDLYYRLNMLKFDLPPLRDRKADIMPMAKTFVTQQSEKHGITIIRIERSFFDALYAYPWPGNVRELENVVQRAVIYSREGVLSAQHLPPHIVALHPGPSNESRPATTADPVNDSDSLGDQIALTEKEIIEQALFRNSFSRTNTAKELGISRVTLYNKMKKYDMMK